MIETKIKEAQQFLITTTRQYPKLAAEIADLYEIFIDNIFDSSADSAKQLNVFIDNCKKLI